MSWTHINDTKPTARKEHGCYLCGLPIPAGVRHVKRVGIHDREWINQRMHEVCESLTKDWRTDEWETLDEGTFVDEVLPPEALAEILSMPGPTPGKG